MTATTYSKAALEDFHKRAPGYTMTVLQDSGTHRHLKFRIDGSMVYGFDIVTWPGYLSISGDMGCFVFCRLTDMFEFFRGEPGRINPSYWAEKLKAADPDGGYEKYSPDQFREHIMDWLGDHAEDGPIDSELMESVQDEVLSRRHDDEYEAMRAAIDFTHEGRQVFQDFGGVSCREYTYHYLWCLYAIVQAINWYDAAKDEAA